MTVLEHNVELAMRDCLKLKNALNVDNCGSMDADEARGIKPLRKVVESGAVEHLLAAGMEVDIDTRALDPINIRYSNEAGCSRRSNDKPIQRPFHRKASKPQSAQQTP